MKVFLRSGIEGLQIYSQLPRYLTLTLGLGQQRLNSVIHIHSFHWYLLIFSSEDSLVNTSSGAIYSSVSGALLNSTDKDNYYVWLKLDFGHF